MTVCMALKRGEREALAYIFDAIGNEAKSMSEKLKLGSTILLLLFVGQSKDATRTSAPRYSRKATRAWRGRIQM